jgi:ribonuclease Z
MDPRWFVPPGADLPETMAMPTPRLPREDQQEQWVRDLEIDPDLYWPADAKRPLTQQWPNITLNPREMLKQRGIEIPDK